MFSMRHLKAAGRALLSYRELEAHFKTVSLRLDSAETDIAVLQKTKSVSGQQGVDLRTEVQCLGEVLTEAVELLNRLGGTASRSP